MFLKKIQTVGSDIIYCFHGQDAKIPFRFILADLHLQYLHNYSYFVVVIETRATVNEIIIKVSPLNLQAFVGSNSMVFN